MTFRLFFWPHSPILFASSSRSDLDPYLARRFGDDQWGHLNIQSLGESVLSALNLGTAP